MVGQQALNGTGNKGSDNDDVDEETEVKNFKYWANKNFVPSSTFVIKFREGHTTHKKHSNVVTQAYLSGTESPCVGVKRSAACSSQQSTGPLLTCQAERAADPRERKAAESASGIKRSFPGCSYRPALSEEAFAGPLDDRCSMFWVVARPGNRAASHPSEPSRPSTSLSLLREESASFAHYR
ncbi:hypothetical protein HPB51_014031 [Rhipicephalus microplus]|uniref:Uncharacterized protein n=1 Tax=Rhipicephalus microplus TaxID=6941 RepID=A0A9J6D9U9_RHIMP|nr:hypothetical protein HPB51_014031 [Rhipicephalus microplus]